MSAVESLAFTLSEIEAPGRLSEVRRDQLCACKGSSGFCVENRLLGDSLEATEII